MQEVFLLESLTLWGIACIFDITKDKYSTSTVQSTKRSEKRDSYGVFRG